MTIDEKVKRAIERHPDWSDRRIACSTGGMLGMIAQIRGGGKSETSDTPETSQASSGVFSLRGVRLLSKKPADCMKARLYGLRRGMGYRIADLSAKWGISEDTIRTHAKKFGSLVFVEATPGEYVACVVHPETPKGD